MLELKLLQQLRFDFMLYMYDPKYYYDSDLSKKISFSTNNLKNCAFQIYVWAGLSWNFYQGFHAQLLVFIFQNVELLDVDFARNVF